MRSMALFGTVLASYVWQMMLSRVYPGVGGRRWPKVHARNARRLTRGFVRLRGIYIKLGQILSVMGTFLPDEYPAALEVLQDQVPPRRSKEIVTAIEKAFGKPPEEIYDKFELEPVAAASLGQVHRAEKDGQVLAVKVLYPGIRKVIAIDVRVLRWVMKVYHLFVPAKRLERVHEQVSKLLDQEMDLAHEAKCMREMSQQFENEAKVAFPTPLPALCNSNVLTMSFEEGVKVTDFEALKARNIDKEKVAEYIADLFCQQFFVNRFFHADPHPGNILVRQTGDGPQIVFLDLGSATVLPDHFADGISYFFRGVIRENDQDVVRAITTIGFVGEDDQSTREQITRYFSALVGVKGTNQDDLRDKVKGRLEESGFNRQEFRKLMKNVEYPDDWLYVERSLAILIGLITTLSQNTNMFFIGAKYLMPLLAQAENDSETDASLQQAAQ